jgi:cobalamin biosynthesis protein CobC
MSGASARDHGGNIGAAVARYGGALEEWIDLSTGINRLPYAATPVPAPLWQRLPTAEDTARLLRAAQRHYSTDAPAMVCAGAQAAIQMIPQLRPRGRAAVLVPSYNEHAAALRLGGWQVTQAATLEQMDGADLAVVVNPNNPDGRRFSPAAPQAGRDKLLILRSFGKFWGLAGARLGLVFGPQADLVHLAEMAGPWPVSGPALHIAALAYGDTGWADATRARLHRDAERLDDLARGAGWQVLGGTGLFRLYGTPDAPAAQSALAQHRIWSRIFPYSPSWLRLGMPGDTGEWQRLAQALQPSAPRQSPPPK